MNIKVNNFKMEAQVDTIGEHYVTTSFFSEQFQKEFKFIVKVILKEKKMTEATTTKTKKK